MDMRFIAAAVFVLASTSAIADTYKCVDPDGKVSFAFTPCPTWQGDSSRYGDASTAARSGAGVGGVDADMRNRRAVEDMVDQRQSKIRSNGHIGIVRDATSGIGKEQIRQEEIARRKADRAARVAAGLEAPARPMNFNCYSYGSEKQFTHCSGR
ncbi:DUF4124 domain-containing protein [Pseudomonas syringae]|uniref:DUF4124 domain-containing protein n=1 Tax=Pseudomonas syringae TaxID=317 RepID=UPI00136476BF|nr:DUF4124 domain-containing protein [Pseudomonas syringae]